MYRFYRNKCSVDGSVYSVLCFPFFFFFRHNLSSFERTFTTLCVQKAFSYPTQKPNVWFISSVVFLFFIFLSIASSTWSVTEWVTIQADTFNSYVSHNIPEGNVLQYFRYRLREWHGETKKEEVYTQSGSGMISFFFHFITRKKKDESLQFGNIWNFWKAWNCRNNTIGNHKMNGSEIKRTKKKTLHIHQSQMLTNCKSEWDILFSLCNCI